MTSSKSAQRPGARPVQRPPSQARGGPSKAASARAQLAAERARQERRRRRLIMVVVPIAVVLVAVGALVVVKLTGLGSRSAPAATGPAETGVVGQVTSVPPGVLDQIGAGTVRTPPQAINDPPLTADGKPRVLYVGAEYCPYCAAERWAMVVALSRFGTFSGLGQTASSTAAGEPLPGTATLSFHGSRFTSSTISFTGVETEDGKKAPLDTVAQADEPVVAQHSQGSIPFVDIGGRYVISGASYDGGVLQGKTHAQIAAALSDPASDIAKAVDGTANVITAAICASTDNTPSAVCSSAGVQAGAKALG